MKNIFLVVLIFTTFSLMSQNSQNKWAFGVSIAAAKYTPIQATILKGEFVHQSPRINVTRYLLKNFVLDAGFSTAIFDTQKYTTLDWALRYDFGTSYDNVVPYISVGGSLVNAIRPTPTVNLGVGNTFWVSSRIGLNIQVLYKYSEDRYQSQYSHIYASAGLVYSLSPRSVRPRLWDLKH